MNSLLNNTLIVIVIKWYTGEYIVIILYSFVCNYSFEYFPGQSKQKFTGILQRNLDLEVKL
jgi:hypothetical protein